jgi:DNA modification methylase
MDEERRMTSEDLSEVMLEEEEADDSPLVLSLRYQSISVHGAELTFLISDLSRLTIGEKNDGGINALDASDYRALSWGLPKIRRPIPTWENGSESKTPSMPERRRWLHGGNMMSLPIDTIICGDCLPYLQEMESKSIDLVLTDPPYGISISSNPFRQKFQKDDWDNFTPTKEYFDEIFRVSKEQIIWGGNYFDLPASQCFYVWDKVQPRTFSSSMCEMAWVSKQSPAKLFKKRVIDFKKYHPTTKPLELMAWCISFFPEAKIILDPFAGSGTTCVAAKRMGRHFIGIEQEPQYVDIANMRIAAIPRRLEEWA